MMNPTSKTCFADNSGSTSAPGRLRPYAPIFCTEGERDCDNVRALGLFATCVAGGVWTAEIAAVLKDRDVIYLEDHDNAGREKAAKAGTALQGYAKSIRIASFSDLPEKGDVSDWIALDRKSITPMHW